MNPASFYQRQTILKEIGDAGQKKLTQARVLIIGAGGLGHPVATYLAGAGVGHLTICDHDHVEESNLHRQILFTPKDIGKPKAEVLSDRIRAQNPLIQVHTINHKLTASNAQQHLACIDVIVDCCDNFATKFLLHDSAFLWSKDLVQASIYQMEGQLQIFPFQTQGRDQGCLRCLWPTVPSANAVGSCAQAGVIGAVPGVLGTLQAMEVIKLICGFGRSTCAATTTINLLDLQTDTLKWRKQAQCSLCGDSPTITTINEQAYQNETTCEVNSEVDIELSDLNPEEFILIDLRSSDERLKSPTRASSEALLFSDYEHWKNQISKTQKTLFICQRGFRSADIAQRFRSQGYQACYSLKGGIENAAI
ncbi:MAG: hypothetical protein COB04_06770 [Gammaproteobacteria bacterium]|nr:MAG: hypothetical protein COB04_06770 [Gammaproteobacteria bacterium]